MQDQFVKQDLLLDLPASPIVTEDYFERHAREISQTTAALISLAEYIHRLNQKWWKIGSDGQYVRNKGEAIALMHSELSEALEGIRKDKQDDHLPEFKNEVVEFADCIIRILDYCIGFDLPIGYALFAKLEYNASRADHKIEDRMKDGGKKF